jgi:hypothetical protein
LGAGVEKTMLGVDVDVEEGSDVGGGDDLM